MGTMSLPAPPQSSADFTNLQTHQWAFDGSHLWYSAAIMVEQRPAGAQKMLVV